MASSSCGVAMMVGLFVIYCFCLFKQKKMVRVDVSINTNMYCLKPAAEKEISREDGNCSPIPSSTMLGLVLFQESLTFAWKKQ